ncbi:rect family [Caudoviricetes sp.]|nr:rect family [Caudoviricetes sp.]
MSYGAAPCGCRNRNPKLTETRPCMSEKNALALRTALPPMSFGEMVSMGDQLVRTGFLPQHLKNGAQVAAVILTGRELGMEPMRAIRSLQLVKGKVTENADSQLARFKADGGRAQFKQLDDAAAVLYLKHPNGDEHTETFTIQDARNAGILSDMYKKYPRAMLRSRAITAGLKSVGWDGAVGNYDPEELQGTPLETTPEPDRAEYVRMETVEPKQLAAPKPTPMTLEEAEAMTVRGKALGSLKQPRLTSIREWAESEGNDRLALACDMILAAREDAQATDDIEELDGSLPMNEVAA